MKTGKTLGKHKDREQMANIPELSIESHPDCQTSQIVAIHPSSVVVLFLVLVLVAICPSLVVVVVPLIVVVVAINPSLVVVVPTPMFDPPPSLLLL